ncbi:HIT family protein [Rhodanobacter sp. C01]|uniref:HIT family protein n=1 Tax=Rhodanobacter sp. C01 TaxID=1945856 RepID=UPI0009875103|nr:HIT family protein [Rhodanobacter sp. C01]OOG45991.1 diadenosine tetraphosphate hydrolase [Rhodanobacter sp. C01]
MRKPSFILDPRLDADTRLITSLALCDVRLMNDVRFPWLVLVPRHAGLVEIADLPADEQTLLWQEVNCASAALRTVAPCDKLNLGALGNIVRQLHVHVIARCEGDPAWPGPVWGYGSAQPYLEASLTARLDALRQALANAVG